MQTAPDQVLAKLRTQTGTEQMATFAEALFMRSEAGNYQWLPYVAAAYLLGRTDALRQDASEVNGSGGPMAERVLRSARVLHDHSPDDLPF